jgi:hypothetical protein
MLLPITPGKEFPDPLTDFTIAYATYEDIWHKLHTAKKSGSDTLFSNGGG